MLNRGWWEALLHTQGPTLMAALESYSYVIWNMLPFRLSLRRREPGELCRSSYLFVTAR